MPDGSKIKHYRPARACCPFCNVVAGRAHIFKTCPVTREIYRGIDALGLKHWGSKYWNLDYNEIPVLFQSYQPVALYHISALWGLWRVWTTHFFEADYEQLSRTEWIKTAIVYFFKEVVHRIWECMPIIQWIKLQQSRHDSDSEHKIPEKEFLLKQGSLICPNMSNILPGENTEFHPLVNDPDPSGDIQGCITLI